MWLEVVQLGCFDKLSKMKAYVIGIAGRTMSGLSMMLKDEGWEVTGSDQNAYPPATTYLENYGIQFHLGYDAMMVPLDVDVVIVGGNAYHVMNPNPEVEQARKLGLKVQSYPEFFHEWLEKKESLVVVGTYGKTTTCALLAWIMEVGKKNPSFDIAEIPLNFKKGTRNTNSEYSIIHGDEHPTLGYSELPKFAYFNPRYVILTAALWDHFNIYSTEQSYVKLYADLVARIPKDGWLLMSLEGENNDQVALHTKTKVYKYSFADKKADFFAREVRYSENGFTTFEFVDARDNSVFLIKTLLFGRANIENSVAAIAAAKLWGVGETGIKKAMLSFKGLKRHLESLLNIKSQGLYENILFYLDQGQHPQKARGAIEALKEYYPNRKLIVMFDPHASVLHDVESLNWYKGAFDMADEVIVGKMKIRKLKKGESKENRVTGKRIANVIKKYQSNVRYLPTNKQIVDFLKKTLHGNEVLLFLSTGDFEGLMDDVFKALQ